ncbi:MAG: anthranilate phosphoribosyltransferase, partial [Chloroflexota bacterium]|nr:anthranilate phosphoribosyltransferase [Chloroflexota bacterium]
LAGGTPEENVLITKGVLSGKKGPQRDIVLLNAAAALVAGGVARSLKEGKEKAAQAIDSGQALKKLNQLVELSRSFG